MGKIYEMCLKTRLARTGSFPETRTTPSKNFRGSQPHLLCHKVILQVIRGNYSMSLYRIAQKYIFRVANFRSEVGCGKQNIILLLQRLRSRPAARGKCATAASSWRSSVHISSFTILTTLIALRKKVIIKNNNSQLHKILFS